MSESPALERALAGADDRLRLNHWMPPKAGIVPRIRIGARWISVLWGLPIGVTALIVLIAIAQSLRELPCGTFSGHRSYRSGNVAHSKKELVTCAPIYAAGSS